MCTFELSSLQLRLCREVAAGLVSIKITSCLRLLVGSRDREAPEAIPRSLLFGGSDIIHEIPSHHALAQLVNFLPYTGQPSQK